MNEIDANLGQFSTPTPGRVIYPNLSEEAVKRRMAKFNEPNPRYGLDLGFDPADPTYTALKNKAVEVAKAAFPGVKIKQWKITDPTVGLNFPFLVGDDLAEAGEGKKDFYKGLGVLRASSTKPVTISALKDGAWTIVPAGDIYGGCYAVVQVNFRPYPAIGKSGTAEKPNKDYSPPGVKAFLNQVGFIRDGGRIGGGRDPAVAFANVEGSHVAESVVATATDGEEGI